jgi:hypothetical protein
MLLDIALKPYREKKQCDGIYNIQKRVYDFMNEHYIVQPVVVLKSASHSSLNRNIKQPITLEREAFEYFNEGPKNHFTCNMAVHLAAYLLQVGDKEEWERFHKDRRSSPPDV